MFFRLVLDAFDKVTPDRKCYRMVGGVLVERSVAEVKPALEDHRKKVSFLLGFFLARCLLVAARHMDPSGCLKEKVQRFRLLFGCYSVPSVLFLFFSPVGCEPLSRRQCGAESVGTWVLGCTKVRRLG